MSQRLIRDDMLDSERLQTLPVEARWLFLAMMLTADDVGLFEISAFKLGRKACLDIKGIPVLIQIIADADLIRPYSAQGKQLAFIPRFGQRLQIKRTRHPLPPAALMADDDDAINKINGLTSNPRLGNSGKQKSTVGQPPEPEPEPEPEEEKEKKVAAPLIGKADAYAIPNCPYQGLLDAYHEACPSMAKLRILTAARTKHAQSRWKQVCAEEKFSLEGGLEWFSWYFKKAESSDFLTGRVGNARGRTWRADFDWLMGADNFAKVVEGRYHGETA